MSTPMRSASSVLGIAKNVTTAITTTGHSVANVNGSLPPSGNANVSSADGQQGGDDDRRPGKGGTDLPVGEQLRDRDRGAAERREQRRDRAGQRGEQGGRRGEPVRRRWSATIAAIAGSIPNANASRPVNRLLRGGRTEPRRPDPRVGPEMVVGEHLEQRRRSYAREPSGELR